MFSFRLPRHAIGFQPSSQPVAVLSVAIRALLRSGAVLLQTFLSSAGGELRKSAREMESTRANDRTLPPHSTQPMRSTTKRNMRPPTGDKIRSDSNAFATKENPYPARTLYKRPPRQY